MPRYEVLEREIRSLPTELRERAEALIEVGLGARMANPLHGFTPYKQQAQFLGAHEARVAAFFGGNRAGKTTTGVIADVLDVTPRELIPEHLQRFKHPDAECPRKGRIEVPSTKLINNQLIEIVRAWLPRELYRNGRWKETWSRSDYMLRLECGCFIECLSYEMDRDKHGGTARHWCHYDEEPPQMIREECAARLVDYDGVERFTMTPLDGMTWMFDEVWLKADEDERTFAVVAAVIDNPNISEEGVLRLIERYKAWPEQLAARVFGRFVHFGGMVYPAWREWRCDPPTSEWLRHQEIIVGLDPGARGFGHTFMALDDQRRQFVFQAHLVSGDASGVDGVEYQPKGANVMHSVAAVKRILSRWGLDWQKVRYVMDPAARARSPIQAETVETLYIQEGIWPERGQNDVEAGILNIRTRGQEGAFFVSRENCDVWEWEAERYRIQDREDEKFAVVKEKDHVMDSTRYASMAEPYVVDGSKAPTTYRDDVAQPPPRFPGRPRVGPLGPLA